MPTTGPIRPARRGLLLVAVFVGLAAGATGLAATAGTGLHGSGPAQGIGWGIGVLCFAVLIGLAANYGKWRNLGRSLQPHSKTSRLRSATAAVLFAGAVLVPILVIAMARTSSPTDDAPPPVLPTIRVRPTPSASTMPVVIRTPRHAGSINLMPFLIGLGVIAGIVLICLVAWRLRGLRVQVGAWQGVPEPEPEPEPEGQALADAMSAGRRALQGDDARAAIIACYAAMERSLAAVGIARSVSDSPADLLGRAHDRGLLHGPAPLTLTALFREARFSVHPMGEEQMAAARTALEECAGQLAGAQAMAG